MKKEKEFANDPDIVKKRLRFLVLTLVCMSLFSNYFIFDQPALLKGLIVDEFTPIYGSSKTNFFFSFLYSFYSIPNIILPLIGGFLSDIFGYRRMSILFMVLIVAGQGVVYMGSYMQNLKLMIMGRFLFGLGGESIGITSNVICVKWFVGKELSFANALNLSIIRTASVLSTFLSPKIAVHKGMNYAFGFGFFLTFFSLASLCLLNYIDYMVDKNEKVKKNTDMVNESNQVIDFYDLVGQIISDIKSFNKMFWLMTFIMTTFYTSVLIFVSFSSSIMMELWLPKDNNIAQNQEIAGDLMGIPYLCCTILSPLVGLSIDRKGQRIKILILASFLVFLGLVILGQIQICFQLSILFFYPIYTMILLGVGYALFGSTIWTAITYVVPDQNLGTAYGVMNSVQNFAFFLMPLFIAIISTEGSQITVVLFFLILACITLIISVWLFKEDYNRGISLDSNDQKALKDFLEQEYKQETKKEDRETQDDEEQIVESQ